MEDLNDGFEINNQTDDQRFPNLTYEVYLT